jgi:DNA-binding LytR/AlgR family response regulator
MSKLKILIVEDEMIIANDMKFMLTSVGYVVCGIAKTIESALKLLEDQRPDLALLDINLGKGLEGVQLSEIINERFKIPFIFCTSYSDSSTVTAAKKVQPSGYLLKPFTKDDLFVSIEIALSKFSVSKTQSEPDDIIINDSMFIKEGRFFTKVSFQDILWIQQDRNYVEIHTMNRVHPVRSTLKDFAPNLPERQFFQVHRSFIVNVNQITAINSDIIRLHEKEIPISKNHKEELMGRIKLLA